MTNAVKTFVKDILISVSGFFVMYLLCSVTGDGQVDLFMCIFGSGILHGWKISSHVFTAVTPIGIAYKAILAFALGLIAAPIVIIKDIILIVLERRNAN